MTLQGFCYECRRSSATAGTSVRTGDHGRTTAPRSWRGGSRGIVSDLTKAPEQLREDLERMVEFERRELRTDPEREAEANRVRSGYQDLAAKGLMTPVEPGEKLEGFKETRTPSANWRRCGSDGTG